MKTIAVLIFAILIIFAVAEQENGGVPEIKNIALKEVSPNPVPRSCVSSSCNNLCLVYGYLGGICISGECYCVYV